jgi:hypothetical protein
MKKGFPERFRIVGSGPWMSNPGDEFGAFIVPGPCGRDLRVIASSGDFSEMPWEHVSVSLPNRCPNWQEMCFVKSLFWEDEEAVMQLHPPRSTWINNHPFCLHLWKPMLAEIPLPPQSAVGLKKFNVRE